MIICMVHPIPTSPFIQLNDFSTCNMDNFDRHTPCMMLMNGAFFYLDTTFACACPFFVFMRYSFTVYPDLLPFRHHCHLGLNLSRYIDISQISSCLQHYFCAHKAHGHPCIWDKHENTREAIFCKTCIFLPTT